MKLVFLDSEAAFRWVLTALSAKTGRQLNQRSAQATTQANAIIQCYCQSSLKASCTIGTAAEVVTRSFKRPEKFFEGKWGGMPDKKAFAREAAVILRERAFLLSPSLDHFHNAEQLWLKWCDDQTKESYAQFSDYVDTALVLKSPEPHAITHAVLTHPHVQYVLRKEESSIVTCVLDRSE
jgi:hypothetical protein